MKEMKKFPCLCDGARLPADPVSDSIVTLPTFPGGIIISFDCRGNWASEKLKDSSRITELSSRVAGIQTQVAAFTVWLSRTRECIGRWGRCIERPTRTWTRCKMGMFHHAGGPQGVGYFKKLLLEEQMSIPWEKQSGVLLLSPFVPLCHCH